MCAGLTSQGSRYLFALCCIQLGKLNDAKEVLTKLGEREVCVQLADVVAYVPACLHE